MNSEQVFPKTECSICGIKLLYPWSLSRHVKTVHLHRQDYVCQYCGKSYSSNCTLKNHLLKHENLPANCKICGEILATNAQINNHRNLHLESGAVSEGWLERPRIYKCRFCKERFGSCALLTSHAKIHAYEKEYQCTICPRKFGLLTQYRSHMQTHRMMNQPKSHLCQVCGEGFHFKSLLQNHQLLHSDVKPFFCHNCGKSFRWRQGLIKHMRTHTGEKPYKCEYCGKGFSQDGHRKIHLCIHTGEKPYVCNQCDKSYRNKTDLKLHCKKLHPLQI